ncbi:hypothetical protein PoB_007344900, partial [Plakobranchus ocellatus]
AHVTTTESTQTTSIAQVCQNGGTSSGSVCDCSGTGGKVGQYCEAIPRSCSDLLDAGYADGDHRVQLDPQGDNSITFYTYCVLFNNSAHNHVARCSGSYELNLVLSTYILGFHYGPRNFWLGLDNMILLTLKPKNLKFTINYSSSNLTGVASIEYKNVSFVQTLSGYYTAIAFSETPSRTYDIHPTPIDVDELIPTSETIDFDDGALFSAPGTMNPNNCGNVAERGWWFTSSCGITNPLGWSYKAVPGPTRSSHVLIPGVNMDRVKDAIDYISLSIED